MKNSSQKTGSRPNLYEESLEFQGHHNYRTRTLMQPINEPSKTAIRITAPQIYTPQHALACIALHLGDPLKNMDRCRNYSLTKCHYVRQFWVSEEN
eukprot:6013268-Amphidinium_carterae.1